MTSGVSTGGAGQDLGRRIEELERELSEVREQQTATSEILHVISGSPTDIQPVFDTIARSAARLCEGFDVIVLRIDGDVLRLVAHHGPMPAGDVALHRGTLGGRTVIERRLFHVEDLQTEVEDFPEGSSLARQRGHRTTLSVPLMKGGVAIGNIQVRRNEVRPFSDQQRSLLKTFADQAVIAIENTRLFEAEQASKRELQELLEYQTATSEVLNVISRSPTTVEPVFEAIVSSAAVLCGAAFSNIQLYDGELLHVAATHNFTEEAKERFRRMYPMRPDRVRSSGRAILTASVVHVADILEDPEYPRELAIAGNWRALLSVPMIREGKPLGVVTVAQAEPDSSQNGR